MSTFDIEKANKALIKAFIKDAELTYDEDFEVEFIWHRGTDYVVDIRPHNDPHCKEEIEIEVLDLAGYLAYKTGLITI